MSTFVMMTRLSGNTAQSPARMLDLEKRTKEAVRACCPDVSWRANFALLGPYDYCDIFDAPSLDVAFQVSALVRTLGQAETEVWPATGWRRFAAYLRRLSEVTDAEPGETIFQGWSNPRAASAYVVESALGAIFEDVGEDIVADIVSLEPDPDELNAALAWVRSGSRNPAEDAMLSPKARIIAEVVKGAGGGAISSAIS